MQYQSVSGSPLDPPLRIFSLPDNLGGIQEMKA
jgi:hypothetical protein